MELCGKHGLVVVIIEHVLSSSLALLDSTDLLLNRHCSLPNCICRIKCNSKCIFAICRWLPLQLEPALHHILILHLQTICLLVRWMVLHCHANFGFLDITLELFDLHVVWWFSLISPRGRFCISMSVASLAIVRSSSFVEGQHGLFIF